MKYLPPPIATNPQATPPATLMWHSDDYYIPSSNNSSMDVSGALDCLNNDLELQTLTTEDVLNNCFNFSEDQLLEDSFSGQTQTQENIIPFNSSFW